jgi:TetR/AcrR family transcriptional regulator, mexJK operon transcriptional repressor
MPKRKAASFEQRRLQIINGALQVFSTKGFLGATNRDIAQAAGINSPGLIYHYFASKEDLLRAVIEQNAPPMQLLAQAEVLLAMPPETALPLVAQAYLQLAEKPELAANMRLLIGEAIRSDEFAEALGRMGLLRILQLVTDYLQRKMDEGLLRQVDPALAARCFLGPLVLYVLSQSVLHLPIQPPVDAQAMAQAAVAVFLEGMRPDAVSVTTKKQSRRQTRRAPRRKSA